MGGNDLSCSEDNSLSVIASLASFMQRIQIALPATNVVVCSLFYRYQSSWIPDEMSQARYNSNVDQINADMGEVISILPRATTWNHKGFKQPENPIMRSDGTHFNEHGMFKFYKSLRGAILHNKLHG